MIGCFIRNDVAQPPTAEASSLPHPVRERQLRTLLIPSSHSFVKDILQYKLGSSEVNNKCECWQNVPLSGRICLLLRSCSTVCIFRWKATCASHLHGSCKTVALASSARGTLPLACQGTAFLQHCYQNAIPLPRYCTATLTQSHSIP